jgi:hypothetical protein
MNFLCWECRRPNATVLLRAKTGYADGPRPSCLACYEADSASGRYSRGRFTAAEIPADPPKWLDAWLPRSSE